jgi:hypothetical protein
MTAQGAENRFISRGEGQVIGPIGNWGATNAVLTYEASDFELFSGSFGGIDPDTAARFCGPGGCGWLVGVRLPAGAIMSSIELDACDTDAASQVAVAVAVFRSVKGGESPPPSPASAERASWPRPAAPCSA